MLDTLVDSDLDQARVMDVYQRLDPTGSKLDEYRDVVVERS